MDSLNQKHACLLTSNVLVIANFLKMIHSIVKQSSREAKTSKGRDSSISMAHDIAPSCKRTF